MLEPEVASDVPAGTPIAFAERLVDRLGRQGTERSDSPEQREAEREKLRGERGSAGRRACGD